MKKKISILCLVIYKNTYALIKKINQSLSVLRSGDNVIFPCIINEEQTLNKRTYITIDTKSFNLQASKIFNILLLFSWNKINWIYLLLLTIVVIFYVLKEKKENNRLKIIIEKRNQKIEKQKEEIQQQTENLNSVNKKLSVKNQEINQQNIEISAQRDNLQALTESLFQRAEEIKNQNEILEQQKEEMQQQTENLNSVNKKLATKNQEIKQQNAEILAQRDNLQNLTESLFQRTEEIKVQNEKLEGQKKMLETINKEIHDSIEYATRIQRAILPDKKVLEKNLSAHFLFFKPKDNVSGDFYWWTYLENHTVITAADCTGHGVPGAFMSMLGISFLREIVMKEYMTHTGIILKRLRKEIIKSLKQKDDIGVQKDGMDMSIISINHETNVVQFSGANNPLYIIKKGKLKMQDEKSNAYVKLFNSSEFNIQHSKLLYEVKPDKMPIAIYEKMDNFMTHEIQLEKGDMLYLFSDGFADQFGGEKGKKFKYKAFKQLLLANCELSMPEQKKILEETFEEWKGTYEQVDDVVVIGIKI